MKRIALILLPLLLFGCSGGAYKISKAEYHERVRTLGVLPLMLDVDSTIRYPQKEELLDLLRRQNAGKEERLVEVLKEKKAYFDVRPVGGNPQDLFRRLVRGSALRGEGEGLYRRYLFDGGVAGRIASENMVDALLVVIFNGVERVEKRRDRGPILVYLEAPYNSIQATAAVVLPTGEIAWEYAGEPGEVFLSLQYPDFHEAFYNRTDEVRIRFISLPGLERTLMEPAKGLLVRDKFPVLYLSLFERIAAEQSPGLINPLKSSPAPSEPAR